MPVAPFGGRGAWGVDIAWRSLAARAGFFHGRFGLFVLVATGAAVFIAALWRLLPHIIRMRPMRNANRASPAARESDNKTIEGDYPID